MKKSETPKNCPKCSFENSNNANFCEMCGFKLDKKLEFKEHKTYKIRILANLEIERID